MKLHRSDGLTFIAVSYNGQAELTNFEQSNAFWVYCLEGKKIRKRQLLSLYPGSGEKRLQQFCQSVLDVGICRNFGPKSMARLKVQGLMLYSFDGGCYRAVKAYLAKELKEL